MDTFVREKADYWVDGIYAKEDWRYMAMARYIRISPSAQSVFNCLKRKKNPYRLPDDYETVERVVQDFRTYFDINFDDEESIYLEGKWWRSKGKHLFGIPSPAPNVRVYETLTERNKNLQISRGNHDCVVVQLPLTQTLAATMRQLKGKLSNYPFTKSVAKQHSKYAFLKSKMRESTLGQAYAVLDYYSHSANRPLWWIGNFLQILPGISFNANEAKKMGDGELAYRKEILSIAASRLVKKGLLIAENAARGRFPSVASFPEAITDVFKRKPGRPLKSL